MEQVLVNDDKYCGQYVALKSAKDYDIVGSGKTPDDAMKTARQNGHEDAYLVYVPEKDLVHIY